MARRGRAPRALGAALGVLVGGAIIVSTQFPLAYSAATVVLHPSHFAASAPSVAMPWPSEGTAAVSVPSLGVTIDSPVQQVQPIASLTKMMTAYVAITRLPLALGESGPCHTVTAADVALYDHMQDTGQSSVRVVAGTRLCELDLLNGLFVHSAGNYARMLVDLVGVSVSQYVSAMNATARSLGMLHTHYADLSGFDLHSVSTAADQMKLVDALMRSSVIQAVVRQTSVALPSAGVVTTYTPLLGVDGVVGVKSGFTDRAGGCDVLALQRSRGGITFLTFAVVLGQHTGDVLETAGERAYALAQAAVDQVVAVSYHSGEVVGTLGWRGATTSVLLGDTVDALWWQHTPTLTITLAPFAGVGQSISTASYASAPRQIWDWSALPGTWDVNFSTASTIPAGTVIGDVQFAGDKNLFMVLYSKSHVERPPWWQGLL